MGCVRAYCRGDASGKMDSVDRGSDMSAITTVIEAIRTANPADCRLLMAALAERVAADSPAASAVLLSNSAGKTVGYFFPIDLDPGTPPEMTPEEEAEMQRRIATIDNSYTTEEMKEFIRRG